MMDDLKARMGNLRDFLQGASELDGKWFGEQHKPAFWWRKHLSDISLGITRIRVLEDEVKRLNDIIADEDFEQ